MRDNEFDKGVQEKMGEFRLQPSAPVWMEVERRIREQKRRRILFFWFCMAGLLLAGMGGWWMMYKEDQPAGVITAGTEKMNTYKNTNKTNTNEYKETEKNNVTESAREEKIVEKEAMKAGPESQQKDNKMLLVSPQTGKTITPEAQNTTGKVNKKNNAIDHPFARQPVDIFAGSGRKSKTAGKKNAEQKTNERQEPLPVLQTTAAPAVIMAPSSVAMSPDSKDNLPEGKSGETVSLNPIPADSASALVLVPEQPATAPLKTKAKKSKWQTGLLFAFGESKLTSGGISLFTNKNFDLLQSGTTNGNNPGGIFNNQSFADSIPLKGTAFHTGVFAKRKTGKKTAFSAGLNLAYFSGKQRVGAFIDSVRRVSYPFNADTNDGFYRAGSNDRYTNRYYYIQVPLLFHWQLNRGNKLPPIQWENGLAPSFLIGSRALVYDPGGRIFFSDKSVYNSFSLSFQTGLTAEFAGQTKHPLTVGIYYNYQFSRLQKVNPPDYNYLSSYGIQFRWLIKK